MIGTSIFLLPNGTFFFELAVFAVILYIAKRYFLPIVNKNLEARQEKIRTALEAADAARAEAASADDQRARVLAEAREQARTIVAGAQATADQLKAEANGRAQEEYDRIVLSARPKLPPLVSTPLTRRPLASVKSCSSWSRRLSRAKWTRAPTTTSFVKRSPRSTRKPRRDRAASHVAQDRRLRRRAPWRVGPRRIGDGCR